MKKLLDGDTIPLLENDSRAGIFRVMKDRYLTSDETKKVMYIDPNKLNDHSMSQPLSYDEIKFDTNGKLEDILNTADDSDSGFIVEVDFFIQLI